MIYINIEDLWEAEWKNAKAFFSTKGNLNTKCKLKAKWKKEFIEMLYTINNSLKTEKVLK